ncbi:mas-related G-protein coupled receptor member H-like [Heteronotia binoei]|uniref:mas-related G-protein coupled receptor member H-like n=1 Tax=Heteronotia binoei TaxID=13085 RepID=UPI0029304829|nr:mas-related G-protein coupled receptor member H-like [Heteronotia binoei]
MTVADGFDLKTLFFSATEKDLLRYSFIGDRVILSVFIILFSLIGLVGNGNLIRLLSFHIQRKPLAIYILNLAVADFGSLAFLLPVDLCFNPPSFGDYLECPAGLGSLLISLFLSTYSSCPLLLTAISIDRWVSVFFPNWYRRHRSPALSTTVCAFAWALSFALVGVPSFLLLMDLLPDDYETILLLGHILTNLICVLLVIISTLTLLIKVCLKSPRCRCGNLLKAILLVLLSFLLFVILMYVSFFMFADDIAIYVGLWTSLKSSINPLIYFLAGRQNGGTFQERMKAILQRVFKEERDTRMERQPHAQTML